MSEVLSKELYAEANSSCTSPEYDMYRSYGDKAKALESRIKELEGALDDAIEYINYEPKEVLRLNDVLQGYTPKKKEPTP